MQLKKITLETIEEENKKLNYIIDYDFDLVIFVAKGAYLIGADLSKFRNTPILEIKCSRTGNIVKKAFKPLFIHLPDSILLKLRNKEINSEVHKEKSKRNISYEESIYNQYKDRKKIILVDDSVDTGNTIISCKDVLNKIFPDSDIKTSSYNTLSASTIYPNYYLYEDTILKGPWSIDSKDNKEYVKQYNIWKKEYLKKRF